MSVLHFSELHLRRRRGLRARVAREEFAGAVRGELAADLPDEDLGEDLLESLDLYRMGSKPRCEEVEYLALVQAAAERMARGR